MKDEESEDTARQGSEHLQHQTTVVPSTDSDLFVFLKGCEHGDEYQADEAIALVAHGAGVFNVS